MSSETFVSVKEGVKMLQALLDNLPHGSGIDGKWSFSLVADSVHLHNDFEPMNDNGFYDGCVLFSIVIPKNYLLCSNWKAIASDFALHFHGQLSQYLAKKYFLRDYLEDIFSNYFQELAERGL